MDKNELDQDFDKADKIIADAMEHLIDKGINPYVYGIAFLELGVAALTRIGESNDEIVKTVKKLMIKTNKIHASNQTD